jgi:hypothetical protein
MSLLTSIPHRTYVGHCVRRDSVCEQEIIPYLRQRHLFWLAVYILFAFMEQRCPQDPRSATVPAVLPRPVSLFLRLMTSRQLRDGDEYLNDQVGDAWRPQYHPHSSLFNDRFTLSGRRDHQSILSH